MQFRVCSLQLVKVLKEYPYPGASKLEHDEFRARATACAMAGAADDSPVKLALRILSGDVSALTAAPLAHWCASRTLPAR
jgi:hypothetical protein